MQATRATVANTSGARQLYDSCSGWAISRPPVGLAAAEPAEPARARSDS